MARTNSRAPQRPSRRARTNLSYAESDTEPSAGEASPRPTTPRPNAKAQPPMKRKRESVAHTRAIPHRFSKKQKISKHQTQNYTCPQSLEETELPGAIPPWQKLPYEILLQIFRYASHPLIEMDTFHPTSSTKWLLCMARLCKSFAEPALTTLYSSPPLIPMLKAHMLADLLNTDPETTMFKYRSKIESLLIEVHQVAAYSLPGRGVLDLGSLVRYLPRLKALELYHKRDLSPYKQLRETVRWTCPEALFEALEYVDPEADLTRGDKTGVCKLQSWRWSSRLAGKKYPLEMLHVLHSGPVFSSLKKIAFVNYQCPSSLSEISPHVAAFAKSITSLRNLEHLILESCGLVSGELFNLLPSNLRHLEIINCPNFCPDFDANDLKAFLVSRGRQLRSLSLDHNESQNLAFLPILSGACEYLQQLKINNVEAFFPMWFATRGKDSVHDEDRQSDFASIPWPRTLRSIELTNLHHISIPEAELIFENLLTYAHTLPDLRVLVLHATVEASWKDRASFREKWIKKITHVFKYVPKPSPPQYLMLPEPDPNQKLEVVVVNKRRSSRVRVPPKIVPIGIDPPRKPRHPARRSTRVSKQERNYAETSDDSNPEDDDAESTSEPDLSSAGEIRVVGSVSTRSRDPSKNIRATSPSSITSDSEDGAEDSSESQDSSCPSTDPTKSGMSQQSKRRTQFIHGMCDVVSIRIDNQRPSERQATEADFLDAEPSGDEDWNGDEEGDDGYAW